MIQGDVHYADDDDRTAVGLALAALEGKTEDWKTLVTGSVDHMSILAALSDLAAGLADDLATTQGINGKTYLREALLNLGSR